MEREPKTLALKVRWRGEVRGRERLCYTLSLSLTVSVLSLSQCLLRALYPFDSSLVKNVSLREDSVLLSFSVTDHPSLFLEILFVVCVSVCVCFCSLKEAASLSLSSFLISFIFSLFFSSHNPSIL